MDRFRKVIGNGLRMWAVACMCMLRLPAMALSGPDCPVGSLTETRESVAGTARQYVSGQSNARPSGAGPQDGITQTDAARGGGLKVKPAYDVSFEMDFDNRENVSSLSPSMTIFGARLTPAVGIAVEHGNGTRHLVMAGIDVMKDFGRGADVSPENAGQSGQRSVNSGLFRELTFYYRLDMRLGKTDFGLFAGIFPKRFSMSYEYPPAFISDSLKFYDNNYEGLLLTFSRPKSYYEAGCDWMGMFGTYERERFMIFSHGRSQLMPWLSVGYSAYMYHYACSATVDGVVDNLLANPWICFDAAPVTPFQRLSITLGWLQSAQQDRLNVGKYVFPCGGEMTFDIRKWNVGIRNRLFVGSDMMPYYDSRDAGGYKYGNSLYWGDPFYRLFAGDDPRFNGGVWHPTENGSGGMFISKRSSTVGIYDRLEAYYEPKIADFLHLRISLTAHFLESGYAGFQQQVGLVFSLQELMSGKPGHSR